MMHVKHDELFALYILMTAQQPQILNQIKSKSTQNDSKILQGILFESTVIEEMSSISGPRRPFSLTTVNDFTTNPIW